MRVGKKGEDVLEASTVVELADLLILTLLDRGLWGPFNSTGPLFK